MKLLVTGAAGQLGYDMVQELARRGHDVTGTFYKDKDIGERAETSHIHYVPLDITNQTELQQVFKDCSPDVVVHCAAWTAVDAAEAPKNLEQVQAVNVVGTRYIARLCQAYGCKLLYLSTDYVFDGEGETPWQPDETQYHPLNIYGKTKLAGEQAITELLERYFIVRIAWVFGLSGSNFVKTMLRLGETHDKLTVVCDQIGTPTYTPDLARLLADMLETEHYGFYHATNEGGYISWYDFAVEIFRQAAALGYSEYTPEHLSVLPVTTEEYNTALPANAPHANRPFNSRLEKKKLEEYGFTPLPEWKDALNRFLKEYLKK